MIEDKVVETFQKWSIVQKIAYKTMINQPVITDGLEADIVGVDQSGNWTYIAECKGSGARIGDIAKGIGQAYQYFYQKQFNVKAIDADVFLVILKEHEEMISKLQVPKPIKVYLVCNDGKIIERVYSKRNKLETELQLPDTFYIRDIKLKYIKPLLETINKISPKDTKLDRALIEKNLNKKHPEIAVGCRNHLITLKSMKIIDSNNTLSPYGHYILKLLYRKDDSFNLEMINYYYCFIINVLNALLMISIDNNENLHSIKCGQKDIAKKIDELWGEKIRFMNSDKTISTIIRLMSELEIIEELPGGYKIKKIVHPMYLP